MTEGVRYDEKVLSGIGHLGVFFGLPGLLVNGGLYYIYGKRSAFIGAHTRQALLWQVTALAVKVAFVAAVFKSVVAGLVLGPMILFDPIRWLFRPPPEWGGGALGFSVFMWAMYMFALLALARAFAGRLYQYPLVGKLLS